MIGGIDNFISGEGKRGGVSFFIQQKRLQKNDNLMENFQITYLIHM